MESSREGRLGLQNKTNYLWKGKTFSQVTSVLQKNSRNGTSTSHHDLFSALPLKLYRKEIASISNLTSASKKQSLRGGLEIPGGTIVNTKSASSCPGISNTLDINYDESKTARCSTGCGISLTANDPDKQNSKYLQSLSQQENARRRVRSSGMNRPRYDSTKNGRAEGYRSASEYLHSRNRTFKQNQFSNLRAGDSTAVPGSAASHDNVYASNTIQYCGENTATEYVPVYYKPNNSKFAQQGGVDAGSRLLRLKYDTITDGGNSMREAYGVNTANALAYGNPANGYTIKDKVGYPIHCTPVAKDGKMCNVSKA